MHVACAEPQGGQVHGQSHERTAPGCRAGAGCCHGAEKCAQNVRCASTHEHEDARARGAEKLRGNGADAGVALHHHPGVRGGRRRAAGATRLRHEQSGCFCWQPDCSFQGTAWQAHTRGRPTQTNGPVGQRACTAMQSQAPSKCLRVRAQ